MGPTLRLALRRARVTESVQRGIAQVNAQARATGQCGLSREEAAERWPAITKLATTPETEHFVPPGCTAWAIGHWIEDPVVRSSTREGLAVQIVVVPSLRDGAPIQVVKRLLASAVQVATGTCPLCSADLIVHYPTSRTTVPLTAPHTMGCPAADWTDEDRQWLVPEDGGDR